RSKGKTSGRAYSSRHRLQDSLAEVSIRPTNEIPSASLLNSPLMLTALTWMLSRPPKGRRNAPIERLTASPSGLIAFVSMYMTFRPGGRRIIARRGSLSIVRGTRVWRACLFRLFEFLERGLGLGVGRRELERLLELPLRLGEQTVRLVEIAEGDEVRRVERLQLGRPQKGRLGPLLPAVVRVTHQRLPQQAEHRSVLVAVRDGELAVADAVEVITHLEIVPRLAEELIGHAALLLLHRLLLGLGQFLAEGQALQVQVDHFLGAHAHGSGGSELVGSHLEERLQKA